MFEPEARGQVLDLVPFASDQLPSLGDVSHPVQAYLNALAPSSRRPQLSALDWIARRSTQVFTAETMPWQRLRRLHVLCAGPGSGTCSGRRPGHSAEDGGARLGLDHRQLRPSGSGSATPGCRPSSRCLTRSPRIDPQESLRHSPAICTSRDLHGDEVIERRRRLGTARARQLIDGGSKVKCFVLVFNKEKETKGTYRYQEVGIAERDTAVGSLYLKKALVGDPAPTQLRVTIEVNLGTAV